MNPVAFNLGRLTIRWYGIMVALGFLAGYLLALSRAKKRGVDTNKVSDLLFWTMAAAIVGARLFYVVQNWRDQFSGNWQEIIRIDHGGLVFFGGFFGAIAGVLIICAIRRLNIFTMGDILAPCVPLGQFFGRLGCLLNGCCYGHPHDGFPAMTYPMFPSGTFSVFPIQFFYSLANLLTAGFLLAVEKKFDLRGRLFGLFMLIYGLTRFFLEFGRGDYAPDAGIGPFTPAQVICLLVVPAGLLLMAVGPRFASPPAITGTAKGGK